jgi:hypothetical protein
MHRGKQQKLAEVKETRLCLPTPIACQAFFHKIFSLVRYALAQN